MKAIWSQRIQPWNDYIVFDSGKVWSRMRRIFLKPQPRYSIGHSRKQTSPRHNYLFVNLHGRKFQLHRLLALLFIANPYDKPFVCHKDNNVLNNSISNLYWGTHEENEHDKIANDTILHGSRNGFSKLTEKQVLEIRKDYIPWENNCRMLAEKYNVDQSLIFVIIKRKAWKHI